MQKKLIAVAVAGALAAPVAALAQTSTVSVYGNLVVEYDFINIDSGTGLPDRANPDVLQSPGSAIGFKGEEKLGGGLSAWFQCESSAGISDGGGDGFCTRNSALGLKGGFGNVFVGTWDTPMKRNSINVGGRDTGIFGSAFLLFGRSTTVADGGSAGVFKRRQTNSINYDSPNFNGFQIGLSTSSTDGSANTLAAAPNDKRRSYTAAVSYKQGPLALAAGYELHQDFYSNGSAAVPAGVNATGTGFTLPVAAVAATNADDETAWMVAGSYTFGNVKVGALYTKQDWDSFSAAGVGQSNDVQAWHLGVEWKLGGPHQLHFGYTQADDVEGTAGVGVNTVRPAAGSDTGAKLFQVRYVNTLSKRTTLHVGVARLSNDRLANYGLGGAPGANTGTTLRDSDQTGVGAVWLHRF